MNVKDKAKHEYSRIRSCQKPVWNLLYILPFGCFMILANFLDLHGHLLLWGALISFIPFGFFFVAKGLGDRDRKRKAAIQAAQDESRASQAMFNEAVYQAMMRMQAEGAFTAGQDETERTA